MTDKSIEGLQQAVESLHSCRAEFLELCHVTETSKDDLVWDGDVHIFQLLDHSEAKTCYAWSSPVEGLDKRRFYAVLHIPPVTSAIDAVRASIVSDYRENSE